MRYGLAMAKKGTPTRDAPERVKMWSLFPVPDFALLPKSVAKSRKTAEKRSEIRSQKGTPRVSQSQNSKLTPPPPRRQNGYSERFGSRPGHALDGKRQYP